MGLLPKEQADRLYQQGKMPEWFYRQNYKTFQENWIESFQKKKQFLIDEKEIEAQAEQAIEKAIEKVLENFNK